MNRKQKDIKKFLKSLKSERNTFFVKDEQIISNYDNVFMIKNKKNILGLVGYKRNRRIGKYFHVKEVFIVIKDEHQGKGFGKKLLLRLLNIFSGRKEGILIAEILTRNTPSIKLFEKINFKKLITHNRKILMIYFPRNNCIFQLFRLLIWIPLYIYIKMRENYE